jgi:hypothetical protein
MKIKMRQSIKGSVDGIRVDLYAAGETYDLSETERSKELAKVLVDNGWADQVFNDLAEDLKELGSDWPEKPEPVVLDGNLAVTGSVTADKVTNAAPEPRKRVRKPRQHTSEI